MRLKILEIDNACTGCGACSNICPKKCLNMKPNGEGFFYPVYDDKNCIECGLCEKTCHVLSTKEHHAANPDAFYLYHSNDENLLKKSSSGGAFTLFANWVLQQGGIVYGSRYNGDTERLEVSSTDKSPLEKLRKSKYIESYTGSSFSEVRTHLQSGRRVLYCGTPCQVRGLKQFLETTKTKTDLLLCVDFACHGVPSNFYFQQFKQLFESDNRKVAEVDFRHKDFSHPHMQWHNMTLRLGFSDDSQKIFRRYSYFFYFYYEPFLDNLFLRKSCYQCNIASHSDADISLGDFWGITHHRSELDDNKGMSFVCINNPAYQPLWEELRKSGFSEKLPFPAIEYQYKDNCEKRSKQLLVREQFVRNVKTMGYGKAVLHHYGKKSMYKTIFLYKTKTFVKSIIGRK